MPHHALPASLSVQIAGEPVELYGDRALYWPSRARLLIADLHLGKADVFRRAGISLPTGGTSGDLMRLSSLILKTHARSIWILGDMLHGKLTDTHWRNQWDTWHQRHDSLEIAVLAGNHDRALAAARLGVQLLGSYCDDGPFRFQHAPAPVAPERHIVCGHLHPAVTVPGIRRRWPAFWIREGLTVLPAFSAFTGSSVVGQGPDQRLVACIAGELIDVAK